MYQLEEKALQLNNISTGVILVAITNTWSKAKCGMSLNHILTYQIASIN